MFASAFLAGVGCAAVLTAGSLWGPVPEPFFGLEEPPAAAGMALPAPIDVDPPSPAARPEVGGFADMAAALGQPAERLALAGETGPITMTVQAQALPPTAGGSRDQPSRTPLPAAPAGGLDVRAVAEPELQAVEPRQPAAAAEELKALVDRVRTAPPVPVRPELREPPRARESPPPPQPAPLPGDEWFDPDQVNWSEAAADRGPSTGSAAGGVPSGRRRLFPDRRADAGASNPDSQAGPLRSGRLLERFRGERRGPGAIDEEPAGLAASPPAVGRWPEPVRLLDQLSQVSSAARGAQPLAADVATWAALCRTRLQEVLGTAGPGDPRADTTLVALGDAVPAGMAAADALADTTLASSTRRAALAVSRRVAAWRAATALRTEVATRPAAGQGQDFDRGLTGSQVEVETAALLAALERFESTSAPIDAAAAQAALHAIAGTAYACAADLKRTITEHYLAPNVRIAVHRRFVERMLPEATVKTGPMQDFVLGRKVRGTSTVEQSTGIAFVPDTGRIRLELLVRGEVASRTVTDAGPAALHSRGMASFTVRKPISLSPQGLAFGTALGSASNQSQLATVQTSFDGVPIVGSLVQKIVRNQHDESKSQASREVNEKIISRACREVDLQSEPQFGELAERIREKIWNPMVDLGLEPTPVAMESTATLATVRLRLAAGSQLGAHTPRPRAPADALFGLQVHESTLNNGCERLELAGRRFALEDLIRLVCHRIGIEPRIPDDLPEGVHVTFADSQPVRLECRDGLVRLRLALDAIESGRRNWYDVVAEVAYQPTSSGPQVLLERSGQVHLPGHKGLELPLRTIFSKVFPKERPVVLLPARVVKNPRLADVRAVQVVSTDGWFAMALDGPVGPGDGPAVTAPQSGKSRLPAARAPAQRRR